MSEPTAGVPTLDAVEVSAGTPTLAAGLRAGTPANAPGAATSVGYGNSPYGTGPYGG